MKNDDQARGRNPFAGLPPCGAKTRAGTPCKRPAGPKGRCYYHGGAPGSGAPKGNKNAWKHGAYSAAARAERIMAGQLIADSLSLLRGMEPMNIPKREPPRE